MRVASLLTGIGTDNPISSSVEDRRELAMEVQRDGYRMRECLRDDSGSGLSEEDSPSIVPITMRFNPSISVKTTIIPQLISYS